MFRVKTRKDIIIYNRKINIKKIKLTKTNIYFLKNHLYNSLQVRRNLSSSLKLSQNYHQPLTFLYVLFTLGFLIKNIYVVATLCRFLIQNLDVGHPLWVLLSDFLMIIIDININNILVTKHLFLKRNLIVFSYTSTSCSATSSNYGYLMTHNIKLLKIIEF